MAFGETVVLRTATASFLLAIAFATPAAAIDADDVLPCLHLLPAEYQIGAEAEVSASLVDGNLTGFQVLRFEPDTEQGYRIAQRIIIALNMCAPHGDETGDFNFTVKADAPYRSPAIPLPGQQ